MPQATAGPSHSTTESPAEPIAFVGALGLATIQTIRAWRLGTLDHAVTVAVAWAVVLGLVWRWERPPERGADAGTDSLANAIGVAVALGTVAAALLTPTYRVADRALPSIAGAALALAASGRRGLARHRREILLLALPLLNPLPRAVREALAPTTWTAWSAMEIHRAVGHDVTVSGNVLHVKGATLEVLAACGGIMSMSELWALGFVIVALFPTTVPQRLALFASAAVFGFLANAARIAVLVGALSRGDAAYNYWHLGAGSTLFSLGATALAGILWWWMLGAPRRPSMTTGP